MRRLQKLVVASLVWATATSMLMASTPFVVCRCPNGEIKPFCFASTFTKSSCCNDTCCSEGSDRRCSSAKSCCGEKNTQGNDQGERNPKDSDGGPAFVKTCCQKTVVQVNSSPLDRPDTKLTQASPECANLLTGMVSENQAKPSVPRAAAWRVDRLPPPTDLITSLQRLTI
jgi:hypothetical protein